MITLHAAMHTKQLYFLHKKHHIGKADMTTIDSFRFDLLDLVAEFGAGVPLTCLLKYMLCMDPTVHVLSYLLALFAGQNAHAANPYVSYFFNPILDYFARATLCHNLWIISLQCPLTSSRRKQGRTISLGTTTT